MTAQDDLDFDHGGYVWIVPNYWNKGYHVCDVAHGTVDFGEQPIFFHAIRAAFEWAEERGYDVLIHEKTFHWWPVLPEERPQSELKMEVAR